MSLVLVPGGVPEQVPQLLSGAPTRRSDCNVAMVYEAIAFASGGRVTIAPDRPAAFAQIRRWMHKPQGATTIGDAVRALTHPELRRMFADVGLRPPTVRPRRGGTWDRLDKDLRRGAFVDLHVNYGVLRDGEAPTHSSTFRGGHAVGLLGDTTPLTGLTNESDPLATKWYRVRLSQFREAAGKYGKKPWGVGRAEFLSVLRARPVADQTASKLRALRNGVQNGLDAIDEAVAAIDKSLEAAT